MLTNFINSTIIKKPFPYIKVNDFLNTDLATKIQNDILRSYFLKSYIVAKYNLGYG